MARQIFLVYTFVWATNLRQRNTILEFFWVINLRYGKISYARRIVLFYLWTLSIILLNETSGQRELAVFSLIWGRGGGKGGQVVLTLTALLPLSVELCLLIGKMLAEGLESTGTPVAAPLPASPESPLNACPLSGPQVLHLYCDTCSVPICRECTMGRHGGHSFIYLQEALQDSRALTIQLLADAQQGRQAIQVSPSPPFTCFPCSFLHIKPFLLPFRWHV